MSHRTIKAKRRFFFSQRQPALADKVIETRARLIVAPLTETSNCMRRFDYFGALRRRRINPANQRLAQRRQASGEPYLSRMSAKFR